MKHIAWTAAWLTVLSGLSWAQGPGRGGDRNRRIQWVDTMDSAISGAEKNKYIFVYVRPPEEAKDPNEFNNMDIIDMSRDRFVFLKVTFDKEDPWIKQWRVTGAPTILGCDKYGNDFSRASGVDIAKLRGLLDALPGLVTAYETKLRTVYGKFLEALKAKDSAKSGRALAEVLGIARKGYKETAEIGQKMSELEAEEVRKVEAGRLVDTETELEYLHEMLQAYKGTPLGLEAEIRIAAIERLTDAAAAIARLKRVLKSEGPLIANKLDAAGKLMGEVVADGEKKVDEAAKLDRNAAKEALRKLIKEYSGTEAGKKASEALKSLE